MFIIPCGTTGQPGQLVLSATDIVAGSRYGSIPAASEGDMFFDFERGSP